MQISLTFNKNFKVLLESQGETRRVSVPVIKKLRKAYIDKVIIKQNFRRKVFSTN